MKTARRVLILTVIVAIFFGFFTHAFNPPADWHESLASFRMSLAMLAVLSTLHMGAAILFVVNLGVYKEGMRKAFRPITYNRIFNAVTASIITIISLYSLWDQKWVSSGVIISAFALSGYFQYLGPVRLSRLIKSDLPKWISNQTLLISIVVVFSLVVTLLLPSLREKYDGFNTFLFFGTITSLLYYVSIFILAKVRSQIGAHYTSAMTWLLLGVLFGSAVFTQLAVGTALASPEEIARFTPLTVSSIIGGICYLKAGYEFAKTKDI
jgi:hypothetical protein